MAGTLSYLGIRLDRLTVPELIDEIKFCIIQQTKLMVSYYGFHTANIIQSSKNAENNFNSLDILTPDGIAVLWTSWLFASPLTVENRMNADSDSSGRAALGDSTGAWFEVLSQVAGKGVSVGEGPGDIVGPFLYSEAIDQGWGIYLFGGVPGVALGAAIKLKSAFPGLRIVGTHHGYLNSQDEKQEVIKDINQSEAEIVLVGMGQPAQEEWIVANRNRVHAAVLVGVGGYFDHVIRRIDCYPLWVYQCRLNWIYRLMLEPKRLWRRYTIGLVRFFFHVLVGKILGVNH